MAFADWETRARSALPPSVYACGLALGGVDGYPTLKHLAPDAKISTNTMTALDALFLAANQLLRYPPPPVVMVALLG